MALTNRVNEFIVKYVCERTQSKNNKSITEMLHEAWAKRVISLTALQRLCRRPLFSAEGRQQHKHLQS
jgi:hypothetical protein